MTAQELKTLIKVALGQEKADLVILGGNLVNVYSGEVLPGFSVAVKGEKIAYVGKDAGHTIGPHTQVIEAKGKAIIPGFIDGHFHLDLAPHYFARYVMTRGTTSVVVETSEMYSVFGHEGVPWLMEALKGHPVKLFPTAPAFLHRHPNSQKEVEALLSRPEVVALGESLWTEVIDGDDLLLTAFEKALSRGKVVEGHSSAAKGPKLVAYVASGVSSCHEAITAEEALERLRLGMWVMMREGSIRRDLQALAPLKDMNLDWRRLVLVTDGVNAEDLVRDGHMDFVVQKAIDLGFPPVAAIQMATLNVAEHFGLDASLGGIAPGKEADIVLIPEVRTIKPEVVISRGAIVAREGRPLAPVTESPFPPPALDSINLPRPLTAEDFRIKAPRPSWKVKVRVVKLRDYVVSDEAKAELAIEGWFVEPDPAQDILLASVINRRSGRGEIANGFVQGYGLRKGAVACSNIWESEMPITVVGARPEDMAGAVNRLRELHGGLVVWAGGESLAELPLPVGGYMASLPVEEVARRLREVRQAGKSLGSGISDLYLALQTLPSTAMPYLRITFNGLLDVKKKQIVNLFLD